MLFRSGGLLNDTLTGNALDNLLQGNAGNDTLIGQAGNDTLAGGTGDDSYVFAANVVLGTDTLVELPGEGVDLLDFGTTTVGVTVDLGTTAVQTVNANLSLGWSAGDVFELLIGTAAADSLTGNALDNVIFGGAGNDTLTGGDGADRFVFSGAFGQDLITDFQSNDVIQLDASAFANFAAVQSHAAQVGSDVVITLDASNTITLQNVALGSLNAGDFLFA